MTNKISKEQYYWDIARTVAKKSTCLCVEIGCVIVKSDSLAATGYTGSPRKTKDCIDLGYCIRRKNNIPSGEGYHMCRSVHAEANCDTNAARTGTSILDGDMYLFVGQKTENGIVLAKAYPCLMCKKMIINAGIIRFIGNNPDGSLSVYNVADWIKDWQDLEDLTKDKELYQINYKKEKE